MSSAKMTQAERLIRIETLLETKLAEISTRLDKIEEHQTNQDKAAALDKADLEKLKNRGWGILIGVGILAGGAGALLDKALELFK